ncbi:MAG: glycosyltransferase family 2 protein [Lentisphaerota bacterium]
MKKKTSVIIPTLNAEKVLTRLIESLKAQILFPFEILIVDSSSDDKTVEIAVLLGCKVYVIDRDKFDHGGTRKLASSVVSGDILVLLTQDVLLRDNKAIEKLIQPFDSDKSIAVTYGRQLPFEDADPISYHLRLFNYTKESLLKSIDDIPVLGIKTVFCSNSFAAYKKSILNEIGNFPENIIFGEDMYVAAKMILAGYKIAYAADAKVYHSHNYTLIQDFRRSFDVGVFHSRESWLQKEFGKAEKEGREYIVSLFRQIGLRRPCWIGRAFLVLFAKITGYRLGRIEKYLPLLLKKYLSMNPKYWQSQPQLPNTQ